MSFMIEVWGDYACFTRPEMFDRVSYDVMTPSAARGIFESIYWHPGLRWVIDRITVCNPIKFTDIYNRNGDATVLTDVRYIIEAHFDMTDKAAPSDNHGKFTTIIKRRLERGQYYNNPPCFGQQEYPAYFKRCNHPPRCPAELRGRKDLGWMLLDFDYSDPDNITPRFFRAELIDGVLTVPPMDSRAVRR